jgi:hypothetical protein
VSKALEAKPRLVLIALLGAALAVVVVIVIARSTTSSAESSTGPNAGTSAVPIEQPVVSSPVVSSHVERIRRGPVLVVGPASQRATMVKVAELMKAAIPRVTAVWGPHWARRVVVEVPSTQHEFRRLTGDSGDLNRIAALTSAEVSANRGRPKPVGDRVTINPRVWPTLRRVGAAIVLTHELTHVATRADTGSQTPRWLAEGFADYVGYRGEGLPVTSAAAELARAVRAGRLPSRLPRNADFDGGAPRLAQSYEVSWLACRDIATRYGQPALVRFYRMVGRSRQTSARAVRAGLHRVLGLTSSEFTAQWRAYVRARLAR